MSGYIFGAVLLAAGIYLYTRKRKKADYSDTKAKDVEDK